jgi:hypothetical protein
MLMVFFVDVIAFFIPDIDFIGVRCSIDNKRSETINEILYYTIRIIQGLFLVIFFIVFYKLC